MNHQKSFKRRTQLLQFALILGAVLFCLVAVLQMPSVSPLSADFTHPQELSSMPKSAFISTPFPIEHSVITNIEGISDIYAVDLDGDDDLDIIGSSVKNNGFTWWENNDGKGNNWITHTVPGTHSGIISINSIYADKIDHDNHIDVVGAGRDGNVIVWWKNDGNPTNGGWTEEIIVNNFESADDVYTAKIDNNNDVDILAAGKNNDIIWVKNIDSNGSPSWATHTVATHEQIEGVRAVTADKINRDDSYIDVIGVSHTGDNIIWWKNMDGQGITWDEHIIDSDFEGVKSVDTAKINSGDDVDVLAAGENGIAWWQNIHISNDDVTWPKQIVDKEMNAHSVVAARLDKDNDMDIVGASNNIIAWWENQGGNGVNWLKHTIDSSISDIEVVTVGDINGDGYPDILAAGDSTIAWWQLVPDAPELNPIDNADGDDNYQVTWSTDQEVITYTLQQAHNPDFSSLISYTTKTQFIPITGEQSGTYYYRVQAENEIGQSAWSNMVSVTLSLPLYIPIVLKAPSPTPTPTPSCIEVEDEPNNSRDQADRKPPPCEGEWVKGKLPENDDDDFYRIVIKADETLHIELINIPQDTNYNLYLYQINVTEPIARSINPRSSDEEINYDISPGIYYLRVYPFEGRSDEEYSLKWEFTSP